MWVGVGVCMRARACVCVCFYGSMLLLTSPLAPSPSYQAHRSLGRCLVVALCEDDGEERRAEQLP